MRVIAGLFKGRRLASVRGRIRPTADRVREAIFSILGTGAVEDVRVLDLFAGTGALGIEALSRGAREGVFVEEHPVALTVLRRNLETLKLAGRAQVLPVAVSLALKKLAIKGEHFGLVFLDPPYGSGLAGETLEVLSRSRVLSRPAFVVAEHNRRESLPELLNDLERFELRRYGDTQVGFYLTLEPEKQELTA